LLPQLSKSCSQPFDLLGELLVGVDAMEEERSVLRIRRVGVDHYGRARQRSDEPVPRSLPVLVPRSWSRVLAELPVACKSLVHAHVASSNRKQLSELAIPAVLRSNLDIVLTRGS
jgi:hypothetical protein